MSYYFEKNKLQYLCAKALDDDESYPSYLPLDMIKLVLQEAEKSIEHCVIFQCEDEIIEIPYRIIEKYMKILINCEQDSCYTLPSYPAEPFILPEFIKPKHLKWIREFDDNGQNIFKKIDNMSEFFLTLDYFNDDKIIDNICNYVKKSRIELRDDARGLYFPKKN